MVSNIIILTVRGGIAINGNGKIRWRGSCKVDDASTVSTQISDLNHIFPLIFFPEMLIFFALSFNSCKNLRVENLTVMDSPWMHISLEKCTGVDASHLTITAPGESPDTDGIHVAHSKESKDRQQFHRD
ncbi:hypothetical protein GW17_00005488 [Ensete ventricosum]|nr:hypothetical protein GW17_00005488 [Ensete ventricosum]